MKRNILLVCLMIGVSIITGCSKGSEAIHIEKSIQENKDNKELTLLDKGGLNTSSGQGYYYIAKDGFITDKGNYAFNMMYIDYESKKEIYLCNRPGCEHKSEDCTSVFTDEEVPVGSSLFYINDYLYLFSHVGDQDGITAVQRDSNSMGLVQEGATQLSGKPAVIYQIKPDGTERKKVYEFSSNEAVEDTVLIKGESLFFFTKCLSSETLDNFTTKISSTDRKLVEIDTDTWKSNEIIDLDINWKIIGCTENKIVFSKIDFKQELSKEDYNNDNKYLESYRNSETKVIMLDINDQNTKEVLSLSNSKLNTFAVDSNKLYFASEGTNQINIIDLSNLNQSVFKETSANQIDTIYDGVILSSKWEDVGSSTVETSMHFINLKDGTEEVSNLRTNTMGTKIEIRAELDDRFLVVYDYDAKVDTKYENDQYSINGLKYALISKADMYKGFANYSEIEMIGFGE